VRDARAQPGRPAAGGREGRGDREELKRVYNLLFRRKTVVAGPADRRSLRAAWPRS
jgi:hypothetical protein